MSTKVALPGSPSSSDASIRRRLLPPRAARGASNEHRLPIALLFVSLLLHVIYARVMKPDSDEPQHLHMVWAWTQGLLPYRDVFDNHPPLFHWLCAPLFAALGPTPGVLSAMRLAVLPGDALILWAIYRLGKGLYASARVGLWAAALAGLYPVFFFTSSQFRPDGLWAALWLLALLALTGGQSLTCRRAALGGLLLGAAMAVSLKTALMLGALGAGAATALTGRWVRTGKLDVEPWVRPVIRFCVALAVVPAVVCHYFFAKGAWAAFWYGIIGHNAVPGGLGRWSDPWSHGCYLLPLGAGIYLWWTSARRRQWGQPSAPDAEEPARLRREIVALSAAAYLLALYTLWPLVSRQDLLPVIPLVSLVIVGAILDEKSSAPAWLAALRNWCARPAVLAGAAALEITLLCAQNLPWVDRTAKERRLLADVLRLTQPGEYVMDAKGETIYRPRAFFYALEGVTGRRMKRGLIADDIAARLVATGATIVYPSRLPPKAAEFVRNNYLATGEIRILGKKLPPIVVDPAGQRSICFDVAVPAQYCIIHSAKCAAGELDGSPLNESRCLEIGRHKFIPASNASDQPMFLFLANAFKQGYLPSKRF